MPNSTKSCERLLHLHCKKKKKKKKRVCKKQVSMQRESEGEVAKWVTHYCSDHQILLVGDGDFSFSLCLARSFGSAANIVASSLDSYDDVIKKYKHAKSNLDDLQKLGACLLHAVDATKMKHHSDLKMRRFDRIIFNFPHAGFHGKEDDTILIKKHKDLVLGFFMHASCLLRANGEIHVNHKTTAPFSDWNIEKLAIQSFLTVIERVDFRKEDYPGYNNKRGDSYRCDEPFPLGKCSTFKFIYNPRALGQQRDLTFQEIQEAVEQSPTLVDLNYYPQTYHVSKMNEAVPSMFGLTNGYSPISGGYFNNAAVVHGRVGPCASYSAHGMNLGSQRSLQPLQPMQSMQPWPTSTDVRFSQADHVRTADIAPLPLGARHEGYGSIYLQEAFGQTSENAGNYSFDRVRSHFERYIAEVPRRTLSGARNEGDRVFRGSSNYVQEALGRTAENAGYSFDRLRTDFGRYIAEAPRRTLSGAGSSNYMQEALGRTAENAGYRVRPDFERYIAEVPSRTLSGVRNEGYHVFGGSSNYLQEALGRTAENAGYSFERVRSDFERYIVDVLRTSNDDIYG